LNFKFRVKLKSIISKPGPVRMTEKMHFVNRHKQLNKDERKMVNENKKWKLFFHLIKHSLIQSEISKDRFTYTYEDKDYFSLSLNQQFDHLA